MNSLQRPLIGYAISVSISETDESEKQGFPTWQVNRLTLQLVAALFGQGASVVFGHDWREDGVMEAVYGFARQMQAPIPLSPAEAAAENQPMLYNLLPWPTRPYLSESDLEQLSSTLRVESAGLPHELVAFADEAQHSRNTVSFRYLRARGLTFLRHRLTDVSHARLCLGGRRSGSDGRYPGVIEEALLSVRDDKPLYVAGFLGGGAAQVIDAIERREMPQGFCSTPSLQDLYRNPPFPELDRSNSDRIIDGPAVWNEFSAIGSGRLATINGLSEEENRELFHTPVIDRVIELVLTGLSRLRHNR